MKFLIVNRHSNAHERRAIHLRSFLFSATRYFVTAEVHRQRSALRLSGPTSRDVLSWKCFPCFSKVPRTSPRLVQFGGLGRLWHDRGKAIRLSDFEIDLCKRCWEFPSHQISHPNSTAQSGPPPRWQAQEQAPSR